MENLASVPHTKAEIVFKHLIFLFYCINIKKSPPLRHYLIALSR